MLLIKCCLSSLATLFKKRLRHRCFSVNLAKFLKTPILQNTYKWLVLDFAQFYMRHSVIYFINRNSNQPAITYSKLTIETLEQGVKYV